MRRGALGLIVVLLLGAQLCAPPDVNAGTTTTFSNSTSIGLSGYAAASPYPTTIDVSGLSKNVTKVTLTLHNLSHGSPEKFQALVEGPTGAAVLFKQGEGGTTPVSGVNITFDDTSPKKLRPGHTLKSGSYHTDRGIKCLNSSGAFHNPDPPAPPCPYKLEFSAFKDKSPNGTWKLWIWNDFQTGTIAGGWSLNITTKGGSGGGCASAASPSARASCPPTYWTVPFTFSQEGIQTDPDVPLSSDFVRTRTTDSLGGTARFNKKPKPGEVTRGVVSFFEIYQLDYYLQTPDLSEVVKQTIFTSTIRTAALSRSDKGNTLSLDSTLTSHDDLDAGDTACSDLSALLVTMRDASNGVDQVRFSGLPGGCYLNRKFKASEDHQVTVTIGAPVAHFD